MCSKPVRVFSEIGQNEINSNSELAIGSLSLRNLLNAILIRKTVYYYYYYLPFPVISRS